MNQYTVKMGYFDLHEKLRFSGFSISRMKSLVDLIGVEPTTSCMPCHLGYVNSKSEKSKYLCGFSRVIGIFDSIYISLISAHTCSKRRTIEGTLHGKSAVKTQPHSGRDQKVFSDSSFITLTQKFSSSNNSSVKTLGGVHHALVQALFG